MSNITLGIFALGSVCVCMVCAYLLTPPLNTPAQPRLHQLMGLIRFLMIISLMICLFTFLPDLSIILLGKPH